MPDLTAARARELFDLDESTGTLTWKYGPRRGKVSGSLNGNGYFNTYADGRRYKTHRVVWLISTGAWPVDQLDHINGVRTDNRPINLREATHATNQHNLTRASKSSSGVRGVSWHKKTAKWQAQITVDRRRIALGLFDTPQEAETAYGKAKANLHTCSAR